MLSISGFLPDPDYPLRGTVNRWCHEAGFEKISEHGGPIEYTLNFRL